ncbi:terminase large subunit domain-containing protein [Azospirillum soli]|uniref:terminase large subunit domain-containing protein n=1 Tax=Azospirillum soli TaxID=1304799 RepID=UPI001AEA4F4F|nr:terminase family protein [Azospirillum soli]MBP2311897.1 phage terminase large subunit-like protein [Azospirillum soli]
MPRGDNFRKRPADPVPVIADLPPELRDLSPEALEGLKAEAAQLLSERALEQYQPYTKQQAFHAAGKSFRERLLMAGNQLGKTWSAGAECAMHLTGEYPDCWPGRRFEKPIAMWAGGVTAEALRDTVQRVLMGRKDHYGTGMIPKRAILDHTSARGIADALDTVTVRHKSGGKSLLAFKSYEKGREKWQGETLDLVWFDEEPPADIYTEGLARTNATGGFVMLTFTPLLGMSEVVRLFYPRPTTPDRHVTSMTIYDVEHYTDEQRATIIASYPAHERDARAKGIPVLGSGRVFPLPETAITVEPFAIPSHWPQIGGIDFGWDHPTAAVKLAWDRDTDVVYVTATHRQSEATPVQIAPTLKAWGPELPWAWPHDGLQHDKGSGDTLAAMYRKQGLKMLTERATFEDGGSGVEAGVTEMLNRMQMGQLKVFSHLGDWFEEFRTYHRKDGKIVKKEDDLMAATRYALMCLRYAKTLIRNNKPLRRNLPGIV